MFTTALNITSFKIAQCKERFANINITKQQAKHCIIFAQNIATTTVINCISQFQKTKTVTFFFRVICCSMTNSAETQTVK